MPTTTAPTLADRLAEAQRTERPLRERVTALEVELREAVDAKDYGTAGRIQKDLVPAREQAAIAAAEVASLQQAAAGIEAQRSAEQQAIAEAERTDRLRHLHAECEARVEEFRAEARRQHDKVTAAIATAREAIGAAIAAERAELGARGEARDLLVELGDVDPGSYRSSRGPATAERIGGGDPLYALIWRTQAR